MQFVRRRKSVSEFGRKEEKTLLARPASFAMRRLSGTTSQYGLFCTSIESRAVTEATGSFDCMKPIKCGR